MSAPDIFSIGVLSERSGVNIETIRYYERAGLLQKPARSPGGSIGPSMSRVFPSSVARGTSASRSTRSAICSTLPIRNPGPAGECMTSASRT